MNASSLFLLILILWFPQLSYGLEPLERLVRAAEQFVRETAPDATISITPPDSRLRLTACEHSPEVAQHGGGDLIGRVTLAVRCRAPTPWTTYLRAQIRRDIAVVVANRRLERNTRLTAADVRLEPREQSQLFTGYLTDLQSALGHEVQRTIQANSVINPRHLSMPPLVERGATVTLRLERGPILIAIDAQALDSGRLDETIRVRNLSSGRVLRVQVSGPNQVMLIPR